MPEPISSEEMADLLQGAVNHDYGVNLADPPEGTAFELTAPATGQRFRVTVEEIPGWTDRMTADLEQTGDQR